MTTDKKEYKTELEQSVDLIELNLQRERLFAQEQDLEAALSKTKLYQQYKSARADRLNKDKEIKAAEATYKEYAIELTSKEMRNAYSLGEIINTTRTEYPERFAIDWVIDKDFKSYLSLDRKKFEDMMAGLDEHDRPDWYHEIPEISFRFDRKGIKRMIEISKQMSDHEERKAIEVALGTPGEYQ